MSWCGAKARVRFQSNGNCAATDVSNDEALALRVYQNSVQQAEGRALHAVAIGSVSIDGNFLSSQGFHGADTTLAGASLMLHIKRAPSGPPAYAAQGVRSCRALFTGARARSCVRKIVRRANARCRRLPSRQARANCLRAVRRVAS